MWQKWFLSVDGVIAEVDFGAGAAAALAEPAMPCPTGGDTMPGIAYDGYAD